jgi:hypothetical protein
MGKYGQIKEDFYTERTRILEALHDEPNRHIIMRLIGALAFRTRCPEFGRIQDDLGRVFTDFDFASYPRFTRDITRVLAELGYAEDKQVTQLFGERRMLYHDPVFGRHIDVFFNALDFCHTLSFVGRLEGESLTLPLAELLLEKMQIVQINEKDIKDVMVMFREHGIGAEGQETINSDYVSDLLSKDWGFWYTVTTNLGKVRAFLPEYEGLSPEDRSDISSKIDRLSEAINKREKSFGWKMRAKTGARQRWYREVDETGL